MRLVSFRRSGAHIHAGMYAEHGIIDIHEGMALISDDRPDEALPLAEIIVGGDENIHLGSVSLLEEAIALQQLGSEGAFWFGGVEMVMRREDVQLVAPLPYLNGWRRTAQHMAWHLQWFQRRGEHVPMSWYERPPLWGAMTNRWYGDRQIVPFPNSSMCDVECELMWVLGREVCNVEAHEAHEAILGVMLMATLVAREDSDEDVLYGLWSRPVGSVMGPMLTTMDELEEFLLPDGRLNIVVRLLVEDVEYATFNMRDVDFAMGEVVAHASRGVVLPAGSVFSSGVLVSIPAPQQRWLVPGDEVQFDAGAIGSLQWSMEAW